MRSLRILPLLLFGLPLAALRAQHCSYDGAAAIIVEPRDAVTGRVISGLQITLLDSLGRPLHRSVESSTFRDVTSGVIEVQGERWSGQGYEYLWFSRGAYVIETGWVDSDAHLQVRVEDVDGRSDGVFYDPVTLRLGAEDVHPLCTQRSDWSKGAGSLFARTFRPVAITLARRDVQ